MRFFRLRVGPVLGVGHMLATQSWKRGTLWAVGQHHPLGVSQLTQARAQSNDSLAKSVLADLSFKERVLVVDESKSVSPPS